MQQRTVEGEYRPPCNFMNLLQPKTFAKHLSHLVNNKSYYFDWRIFTLQQKYFANSFFCLALFSFPFFHRRNKLLKNAMLKESCCPFIPGKKKSIALKCQQTFKLSASMFICTAFWIVKHRFFTDFFSLFTFRLQSEKLLRRFFSVFLFGLFAFELCAH